MSEQEYNGWANYPTWCVALWLDNDAGTYRAVRDRADSVRKRFVLLETELEKADRDTPFSDLSEKQQQTLTRRLAEALEEFCEEMTPDLGASFSADILDWAMKQVEWNDVARSILTE